MNLTVIVSVITAFIGLVGVIVGAVLVPWVNSRVNRKQKRADVQEQTIKDLQEALAALHSPAQGSRIARMHLARNDVVLLPELRCSLYEEFLDKCVIYLGAVRRAQILTVRIDDHKARWLSGEMILAAGYYQGSDEETSDTLSLPMIHAFSEANERLGEVLRNLH